VQPVIRTYPTRAGWGNSLSSGRLPSTTAFTSMPLAITPTTPRVLVGTLLTRTGKTPSATSLAQGCCKIIPRLTVRDIEYSIRPLVWINQSSDTSYKPSFRDRHVRRHTDKNVVPDFRTNRLPNYRISPFDAISTDCDCCGRTGFVPRLENGGRLMWLCWATSRLPGRGGGSNKHRRRGAQRYSIRKAYWRPPNM